MSLICTRCEGTGFLNMHQLDPDVYGMDLPDSSNESSILELESH